MDAGRKDSHARRWLPLQAAGRRNARKELGTLRLDGKRGRRLPAAPNRRNHGSRQSGMGSRAIIRVPS